MAVWNFAPEPSTRALTRGLTLGDPPLDVHRTSAGQSRDLPLVNFTLTNVILGQNDDLKCQG